MVEPKNVKYIENYVIRTDKSLGKGSYGEVFEGYHIDKPKHILAIKKIKLEFSSPTNQEKLNKLLEKEPKTLKNLRHKHIIEFKDVKIYGGNLYIITELCTDGDLSKIKGVKNIKIILCCFKQIVKAMIYAHSENYIHRDLKLENILLKDMKVKIADFGWAKFLEDPTIKSENTHQAGTPLYMALEVAQEGEKYCKKCDVWSAGIVLYELLFEKTPWKGNSSEDLFKNIKNNELCFPENIEISEDIKDLLRKMLKKNQDDRPTFEELVNHNALKTKRKNRLDEYLLYLLNLSDFLITVSKEIANYEDKLDFNKKFSLQIRLILHKLALNSQYRIDEILKERLTDKDKANLKKKDFREENIKKLSRDYNQLFLKEQENFKKLFEKVKRKREYFDEAFNKYVLSETPKLHKKFNINYNNILKKAIDIFLSKKEKIMESELIVLRLVSKIINIRTMDKIFEKFEFVRGDENNEVFKDFTMSLTNVKQTKLKKLIEKMFKILLKL